MRKLMLAAVSLLMLTNIVVLAGVAYNRSGEPLTSIVLTERELPIQQLFGITDENSGISLSLKWQILDKDEVQDSLNMRYSTPAWLDDDKLAELGFDINEIKSDIDKYRLRTSHPVSEAILVLEYQGEAYQQKLDLAKRKAARLRKQADNDPDDNNLVNRHKNFERQITHLEQAQSRLFVIDAGLDEQALLLKYTDNNKYLLVRGKIGLRWDEDDVEGQIRQLSIHRVHVPLPFSHLLSDFMPENVYHSYRNRTEPPRYSVQLNIGKRLEPWIVSVTQMENEIKEIVDK